MRSISAWGPALALTLTLVIAGCKTTGVSFQNAASTAYDTDIRSISASFEKPEGAGPFPAVVLLHSCGGVEGHLYDWSGFFKARGYAALIVDSFGARGAGPCPNRTGTMEWGNIQMVKDAYGALDYLAAQPGIDRSRIYVMGFSLGGWAVRALANQPPLSKSNSFKAGMVLYAECLGYRDKLNFPTLVVVGSLDQPDANTCKLMMERKSSPQLEAYIIEGARHAFDMAVHTRIKKDIGGRQMLYNGAATAKSKQLVEAFLAKRG